MWFEVVLIYAVQIMLNSFNNQYSVIDNAWGTITGSRQDKLVVIDCVV